MTSLDWRCVIWTEYNTGETLWSLNVELTHYVQSNPPAGFGRDAIWRDAEVCWKFDGSDYLLSCVIIFLILSPLEKSPSRHWPWQIHTSWLTQGLYLPPISACVTRRKYILEPPERKRHDNGSVKFKNGNHFEFIILKLVMKHDVIELILLSLSPHPPAASCQYHRLNNSFFRPPKTSSLQSV